MILTLLVKPKIFLDRYINPYRDFIEFRSSLAPFKRFHTKQTQEKTNQNRPQKCVCISAGRHMSVSWLQIWAILGAILQLNGYRVIALTSKTTQLQNKYLRLFNFSLYFLEDLNLREWPIPEDVERKIAALDSFNSFKAFEIENRPLGKMALSTYSRQRATGVIDLETPDRKNTVRGILRELYSLLRASENLLKKQKVTTAFFTEVFMEEHGSVYAAALNQNLNIIRFAGTVRDNAIVVQRLNASSDRTHFSSLADESWSKIKDRHDIRLVKKELWKNFNDRYGNVWGLSSRNQPNAQTMERNAARRFLRIKADRKVAIIYSHILYDTLFFNGEDIFANYAEWFVETVRLACLNQELDWFVKIHPSNLWRGELNTYLDGKYEEIRLIEEHIGQLPKHVRLIEPDTPLSPYTWLNITDYGITVRGTSGIELGALGKTVITAGTGRYERAGFTCNPKNVQEYKDIIARLPNVMAMSEEQHENAIKFAYATFCMKPCTLDFLKPKSRVGVRQIRSSDDLVYVGSFETDFLSNTPVMDRLLKFVDEEQQVDFLNPWPS